MITKYGAILRMKYVEMFSYQLSTMVWMFGTMVQPLITMMVWMNIYPEKGDSFILYFISLIMVERLTSAWDIWEMDRQIREGTFSYQIVRPFHPIHWAIAENVVYKGLFLVVLVPLWLILSFFVPSLQLHLSLSQWILFLAALILGAIIRFAFSYMFGILGFWMTKVTAVYATFETVSLFISGRIAPFSLLPPVVKQISTFLPYRYMIGFPLEILTETADRQTMLVGFVGSFIWTVLLIGAIGWLWKAGLKKNQAVGG
ncbi:ABC transporter permease [Neobacillus cucumis]|uniref:Multidrug ABC transporter permease n=1 Tax=Neobacillus cucumis TaxID=1740721 RepID=A0A2N5HVN3_9BACI|nr:ABC-2 family transporter protein [Neobacillus cucumis]PLS09573.1 multidrug ABC transporter permease [Neobacillus cucumis]